MNKTYNLTITTDQANLLVKALDLYSRIGMGQLGNLMYHPDLFSRMMTKDGWDIMTLGDMIDPIKQELFGLPTHASHGICSDKIDDSNRVAFDLQQVIRNRLAWDWAIMKGNTDGSYRAFDKMMGVSYDTPYQTSDKVALAKIEEITE